jgi:HEAT repeat protein
MSLFQLERDGDSDELLAVLAESDDPAIRARAAEILGGFAESDTVSDEKRVVETLVETVDTDPSQRVRATAIDALDKHGQPALEALIAQLSGRDLGSGADWIAARAFAETLDAEQAELRMASATGLGRVGDPSATAPLVERLKDRDSRVRTRAATACGRIGDPRAVPKLEARLAEDDDPAVRRAAVDALGEIGTDPALRALLSFTDDRNESVRRVAVDALGKFGRLEPVDNLVEALDDNHEMVRRTAIFSLVELLSNAPLDRSHDIREATADRLESATAEEVVPPLAEVLTESTGVSQRRNAAWLLGRVTDPDHREPATAALIETLGADDGMTAKFAATSLTRLDGPGLEDGLLELLADENASTDAKSKALFVLGKIGGDTSRSELEQFIDRTDDETLRERAFSALSKLGGMNMEGQR